MKKLLFKCLMLVAMFGLLIPFLGIQSVSADYDCDIDDLIQWDVDEVKVKYDSKTCPSPSYLVFHVRKQGSSDVMKERINGNPQKDNLTTYITLYFGDTFTPGVTYAVDMYVRVRGVDIKVDTDYFVGGI